MTCEGGVCKETKLPDPGTLGGSCDQKNSCKTFQSKALECNLGRCELPGCKSGSIGCPCDPFGKCEEFGGESLSCFNNFCVKGGCKEGELGCPCKKDKKCNDPKNSCDAGLCLKPNFYDLSIDNPKARSCDFLLEDKNTLINSVEYKGQVLGKWKKRANKTALSFIAREDKGLKGEILKINVEKGLFKAENAFNRLKSICYDRLGNPLERIEVKIK